MKSSVFTAIAFLGSAPLVFGRPQDTPLQIGDLTKGFDISLDTDPNSNIIPLPVPSVPSPLPSIQDFPNLAFIDETSGAVPNTIPQTNTPVESTGVSTDYGYTQISATPDDDAVSTPFNLLTEAVKTWVDSILNEESTFGIFGLSKDRSKLVPDLISTDKSWYSFGWAVRNSRPSYALHLIDGGVLLLFTYQNIKSDDSLRQQADILGYKYIEFFRFVQGKTEKKDGNGSGKLTHALEVYDDDTLQNAINSFNHAEAVYFNS